MSIAELCKITSLDEETIKEQVLPSLNALPTPTALRAHLESLIGFTPEARAFTSTFVQSRFSNLSAPNSRPSSRPPSAPSSRPHTPNPRPTPQPSRPPSSAAKPTQSTAARPTQGTSQQANINFPVRQSTKAPLQLNDTQVMSLMSGEAKKKLMSIDRGIALLDPNAAGDRCFCQARKHPLSRYTTLCPHCALLLCSLNSPAQPCPSCKHSPLLPANQLSTSRLTEVQRRINLIENERERLLAIWQEQELEAAREKFPSLAGKISGDATAARIENAYKEEPRKVLSLNMKTKNVTATTKQKAKAKEAKQEAKTGPDVEREEVVEDVMMPWVDDEDLGVQSKGKKKTDKFELVYVPLTVAEIREAKARKAEESAEIEDVRPGGMRVRVPGMA